MKLIAKAAIAVNLVMVVFLSVVLFSASSSIQMPGAKSMFFIEDFPRNQPKTELLSTIQRYTEEYRVNLYLEEADRDNPEGHRFVYSFVGDQESYDKSFPDQNYSAFAPGFRTTMIPYDGNQSFGLIGMHHSSGIVEQTAPLFEALRREGFSIGYEKNIAGNQYYTSELRSAGSAVLILGVALILTVVYSTAAFHKKYAVQAVFGYSWRRILRRELLRTSGYFTVLSTVLLAVITIFLGVYNGWREYWKFLGFVAIFTGLLYLVIVMTQAVTVAVSSRINLIQGLKGRKPTEVLNFTAAVGYALVVAIGVTVISHNLSTLSVTAADSAAYGRWLEAKDNVKLTLAIGGDQNLKDSDKADPVFGKLFTEEETLNQAIYAKRIQSSAGPALPSAEGNGYSENGYSESQPSAATDPEYAALKADGASSLQVNGPYLRAQNILDASGAPIRDLEEREATAYLLLPQKYQKYAQQLHKDYMDSLNGYYRLAREMDGGTAVPQGVTVEIIPAQNGQQAFTYGEGYLSLNEDWLIADPAIIVVPAASHIMPLFGYGADISSGYATFTDKTSLERKIDSYGLRPFVYSIDNAAQSALDSLTRRQQELRVYALTLLLAIGVLICALVILCALYVDRSKAALFIQTVHGWSLARKHRLFMGGILSIPVLIWMLIPFFSSTYSLNKIMLQFGSLALFVAVLLSSRRHRGFLVGLATIPLMLWAVIQALGTTESFYGPLGLGALVALPLLAATLIVRRYDRAVSARYMKEQS